MEANIFVTGLEEYKKELDKLGEIIEGARLQIDKLARISWGLSPIVEIKRTPAEAGDKTTAE